jgi:hypothetical protein
MVNDRSPERVPQAQRSEAAPLTTRDRRDRTGAPRWPARSLPGLRPLAAVHAEQIRQLIGITQYCFCV